MSLPLALLLMALHQRVILAWVPFPGLAVRGLDAQSAQHWPTPPTLRLVSLTRHLAGAAAGVPQRLQPEMLVVGADDGAGKERARTALDDPRYVFFEGDDVTLLTNPAAPLSIDLPDDFVPARLRLYETDCAGARCGLRLLAAVPLAASR